MENEVKQDHKENNSRKTNTTNKFLSWFDKNVEEQLDSDNLFNKFLNWFDSNKKLAFLITLLVGIITHITMMTETIMSQDGLWNSMEYNRPGLWEMSLGRWGIEIIQRLNFYLAIPTVSTVLCIISMAIAAVFIVDLFEFKSKISVIFTALFLAITPTLTITLLYIYTAFAYTSNFLIATLVIWFICKYKHRALGIIISICLFTLVLSIYQSYIGVSIGLCIMLTIIDLIKGKKTIKEIFMNILKTIVVVVIGGLLYYGLTAILLKLNSISLATYKDINSFNISDILLNLGSGIQNCYKDFYNFFMKDDIIYNSNYRREVFCGAFLAISIIAAIIASVKIKAEDGKQKTIRILLLVLSLVAFPIGLNFINILVKENRLYALTSVQMILIVPLAFAIMEQLDKITILKWISILSCIYIVGSYYVATNVSYAGLKMRYNQAYAVSIRIMEKIENTPGYNREYPVCIVGIIGDNNYPKVGNLYDYSLGSVFLNPVFHGSYEGSVGTMHQFLRIFLGEDIDFCSPDVYERIVRSEELNNLKDFPNDGCTAVIEDTMVIKLSNYIPLPNGTLLYEEY